MTSFLVKSQLDLLRDAAVVSVLAGEIIFLTISLAGGMAGEW
ncbi:hypothetical protein LT85_2535 [Collimonas arenae]|uniref:Uncharacterized protein n=1 Tax=Collimonas arenae TaxID=279058 RepID=A0A0A1FAC9_9BURK|nr:hypothetical protein [Collimonas arenae]AIY41693.1 hypothetical protein LT85_2535 [Collimonas arenae]